MEGGRECRGLRSAGRPRGAPPPPVRAPESGPRRAHFCLLLLPEASTSVHHPLSLASNPPHPHNQHREKVGLELGRLALLSAGQEPPFLSPSPSRKRFLLDSRDRARGLQPKRILPPAQPPPPPPPPPEGTGRAQRSRSGRKARSGPFPYHSTFFLVLFEAIKGFNFNCRTVSYCENQKKMHSPPHLFFPDSSAVNKSML